MLQGIDGLPDNIMSMLYLITFTTRHIQLAIQCILLVVSVILIFVLVRMIRRRRRRRRRRRSSSGT